MNQDAGGIVSQYRLLPPLGNLVHAMGGSSLLITRAPPLRQGIIQKNGGPGLQARHVSCTTEIYAEVCHVKKDLYSFGVIPLKFLK